MKSKSIVLALTSLLSLAASADVLYWQVNNTAADAEGATKDSYSYAILRATADSSDRSGGWYVSENYNASGQNVGAAVGRETFDSTYVGGIMDASKILSYSDGSAYGASGDSLSALYFFVELYDSHGNWVGQSGSVQSFDQLVSSGAISGFNANFSGVNAALGSTGGYQSVPEPTSGLLMLVGLGALALRRRRA